MEHIPGKRGRHLIGGKREQGAAANRGTSLAQGSHLYRAADIGEFNRDLLFLFSDRCIERITGRSSMELPASISGNHLRENVEKEVEKDRLVIERAAEAFQNGTSLGDEDIRDLFERSKAIDRAFLQHVVLPSLSIQIQYDDIQHIRMKRFQYLAGFVGDLLAVWKEAASLPAAVCELYTPDQFTGLVGEILFLYCIETKRLRNSVRFLHPFNRAMDQFVDELVEAMEIERREVARAMTHRLFPRS
jgi:hypothetical protein